MRLLSRLRLAILATAVVSAGAIAACGGLAFTVANAPALFGDLDRRVDIAYGEGERRRLDVYVPEGARDRPVVIFWYGGTWQTGSKAHYRFVGAALASEGFVAVLPDYRLYPEVRFPEFVDDAAHALIHVRRHAREWGGDPERLFVMGHSAGAHLAAMLALDPDRLARAGGERGWIRGLIGLSGPYALDPNSEALRRIFAAPFGPADWQPVAFVDASAPPALLVHGTDDTVVLPRHTASLADALQASGRDVTVRLHAGRGHADTVAALSVPGRRRAPVLAEVRAFVERLSAPAGAPEVAAEQAATSPPPESIRSVRSDPSRG